MPVAHLTDVVVLRLSTPGTYFDKTTPAFGIRVGKHRKTWIVMRGEERIRTRIGHYPATSLADARKEAKRLLTEPLTRNTRITFGEAYAKWKEAFAIKKPRTQYGYKRAMEQFLLPKLGKKKLPATTYEDVVGTTSQLSKSEERHCLAVARTFLRWCVKPPRRWITHSPLEGVEIRPAKKRKRILTPDEIRAVWNAAGKQAYPYGIVLQLLLLTGQRRGEIANLRWPWINEKERTITLPEWVAKNNKEHTFPYDSMVSELLAAIPRRNTTDLLFPSRVSDDRPLSGWSKYKRELQDGVLGWTLHDLRRTYRSTHGEIGTPREIAERLINHAAGVQTEVEAIYDRFSYMPQMRAAAERYETHVRKLIAA